MNKPIIFNPEIRLSEHFRLGEFTKSITAERLRIVNEPGYEQILAPTATSASAAGGRSMAAAFVSATS